MFMAITNLTTKNERFIDKTFKKQISNILYSQTKNDGENVRPKYKDGTPAYTLFQTQVFEKYNNIETDFPILSLRPVAWKSAIKEILWIYQDQTNSLDILENKYDIHWWNDWEVDNTRTIGQRYGATVKQYDLINKLLNGLKNEPYSRRHIINLYQYQDFEKTNGLYPCAMETHWSVRDGCLDMTLIQRSSDFLVANNINKIQYIALQMMVARHCGFKVGNFCHFVQNVHIYDRHIQQAMDLLQRKGQLKSVELKLNPKKTDFYSFTIDDFELIGYEPVKPNMKFELAI